LTSHRFELLGYCPACAGREEAQRVCRPPGRGKTEEGSNGFGKTPPRER
jgi:hypothetical protein